MRNIPPRFIMMLLLWWCILVSSEAIEKSVKVKGNRFSRELAVIDYSNSYRNVPGESYTRRLLKKVLDELTERGQTFQLEHPAIFTTKNNTKRELYKRIYIPSGAHCFTKEMFQGMGDYIRNGGLLITNSSMVYVDADSDGVFSKNDSISLLSETLVTGVQGRQGGKINQVKSIVKCPLTAGLKNKIWLQTVHDVSVRGSIKASNAEVPALCREVDKNGLPLGAPKPFLCFRHEGYGACIFLAGKMSDNAFKDVILSRIFDNLFDKKTLDWLCLQK